VCDIVERREDQHGEPRTALAQRLQHLESGLSRQSQIEDQQVALRRLQRLLGGQAVVDDLDRITGFAQRIGQHLGDRDVVFGDQDPHRPRVRRSRRMPGPS
jgi:hypothetical protein